MTGNMFGGKNPHGQYTPMTEIEQEVLSRLVEAGEFKVVIKDWGYVDQPKVRFGDARLEITFRMNFSAPEVPQPNYYFDLELWTHAGIKLFEERQPTVVNGKPIEVAAGMFLDLAWDIAIKQIDPAIVKTIKPKAVGLTTRRGNEKFTPEQAKQLETLRKAEAEIRAQDRLKAQKATKAAGR